MSWENTTGQSYNPDHSDTLRRFPRVFKRHPGIGASRGRAERGQEPDPAREDPVHTSSHCSVRLLSPSNRTARPHPLEQSFPKDQTMTRAILTRSGKNPRKLVWTGKKLPII